MVKKTVTPTAHALHTPLAERMRPATLAEYVGQDQAVGKETALRQILATGNLTSLIFWGPPGVGKTTLARIIAHEASAHFIALSGVMSGKDDLKQAIIEAEEEGKKGRRTILFIDEIHRWNKAQQDALLPYVESGLLILIGATTENPSFEVVGALLSRARVVVLHRLTTEDVVNIIKRALRNKERGLGQFQITIAEDIVQLLAELAGGDARVALNALELSVQAKERGANNITLLDTDIKAALQKSNLVFDARGEEFYNAISALHKSMRGSDANAALYWLARMLEGGADPLYVARRVVRFASEDIGMANSEALVQAVAAYQAVHALGYPECSVHLAQAVVYCAKSKKSNVLYRAYGAAAKDAGSTSHLSVPLHLRNATTKLMRELDYGKDYQYSPDFNYAEKQEYFPEELRGRDYLSN